MPSESNTQFKIPYNEDDDSEKVDKKNGLDWYSEQVCNKYRPKKSNRKMELKGTTNGMAHIGIRSFQRRYDLQ